MNIYLHVESVPRELDSKLLLAIIASAKGHKVVVSNLVGITRGLSSGMLAPGIFHTKSLTPGKRKIGKHQSILSKGSIISSIDEEGGFVDYDYEEFAKSRYSEQTIGQCSAVFGWGHEDVETLTTSKKIKEKKAKNQILKSSHAVIIGLDKITAKSSMLLVNLNEIKKFGPLEIKILKCGKIQVDNKIDDVAYMQVKDLTKNDNEKVFIFNGWTFASEPSLTPFDHAIYDLQLVNCYNA